MTERLLIFPFGGNGREALIMIRAMNGRTRLWDIAGFVDDDPLVKGRGCCGAKVLGGREVFARFPRALVLAVPGNPKDYRKRRAIIESLGLKKERFATVIHPSAVCAPDASIGRNGLVMAGAVISCGATVGDNCIILPNTVIAHDASVGDDCCVGSNVSISGGVRIGRNCYIGSGSSVRERIVIGAGSLVGLGATVISDVPTGTVVVGNPARRLRRAGRG